MLNVEVSGLPVNQTAGANQNVTGKQANHLNNFSQSERHKYAVDYPNNCSQLERQRYYSERKAKDWEVKALVH